MMTVQTIQNTSQPSSLQQRIAFYADSGVEVINERLEVLEREWPAGRMVKVTLGVVIIGGFMLAANLDPVWLWLPIASGAFLLQYCFFRRSLLSEAFQAMGFRSGRDIDDERLLMRALRGDFKYLPTVHEVEDKDAVHRMESEGGPALELDERYGPNEAAAIIVTVAR